MGFPLNFPGLKLQQKELRCPWERPLNGLLSFSTGGKEPSHQPCVPSGVTSRHHDLPLDPLTVLSH